jgi:hypothetical protein
LKKFKKFKKISQLKQLKELKQFKSTGPKDSPTNIPSPLMGEG